MSDSQIYYKCVCQNCAGHIEFPQSAAGSTVTCPHCQFPTVLEGPPPAAPPRKKRWNTLNIWFGIAIGSLLAAIALWVVESKRMAAQTGPIDLRQIAAPRKTPDLSPPAPDPWHGLKGSPVELAKAENGGLVYAVGTLRNDSDHERYGVKVEINLFDAQNAKIETSTDYTPSITPGKEWKFRALVLNRKAVRAELVKVTEEK